jgi:hypothetical protein
MGREEKWGGQVGLASLGWLQSPFFIVCLNKGHFFSKSFFINFYDLFEFFHQNIMGREVVSEGKGCTRT